MVDYFACFESEVQERYAVSAPYSLTLQREKNANSDGFSLTMIVDIVISKLVVASSLEYQGVPRVGIV